jgi:succinyl-diaminopimelate desuccinylase
MSSGLNVNSVPDHSEIWIDVRTIPGMRHDDVLDHFVRYLAPELDTLVPLVDLESVWTNAGDPWLRRVFEQLKISAGTADSLGLPFFTDASVLAPALGSPPVLILGPGETALAHQTDEYCFVDKISEAVTIYEGIMSDWQIHSREMSAGEEASKAIAALYEKTGWPA